MRIARVRCSSWTSSFRNPAFVVGTQPSLVLPPLSTVYGLLSAACGFPVKPIDCPVGYRFTYQQKIYDLEAMYELGSRLKYKTNVCFREVLIDCKLDLYITDLELARFFRKPIYPLLLGRSSDLLTVDEYCETELVPAPERVNVYGILVPFEYSEGKGFVHALPTHFTEDIPRKAQGTRLFSLFDVPIDISGDKLWVDPEDESLSGIYIFGCEPSNDRNFSKIDS